MNKIIKGQGFTLIEVLIVVAIIGIISAIALPAYNSYVKKTQIAIAEQNAEGLRMALEDYWIDNETYVAGTWVDGGSTTLTTNLGWSPGNLEVSATVAAGTSGNIATSYEITVTHEDAPDNSVVINYSR